MSRERSGNEGNDGMKAVQKTNDTIQSSHTPRIRHKNRGGPTAMSRERSGHRNNGKREAGHESNAPEMFPDALNNKFGDDNTFNNTIGNISELSLVSANGDKLLITIRRYQSP